MLNELAALFFIMITMGIFWGASHAFFLLLLIPIVFILLLLVGAAICGWATKGMIDADKVDEARMKWIMKDLPPVPDEFQWDGVFVSELPADPDPEQRAQEMAWLGYDPYKKYGSREGAKIVERHRLRLEHDARLDRLRGFVPDRDKAHLSADTTFRASKRGDAKY